MSNMDEEGWHWPTAYLHRPLICPWLPTTTRTSVCGGIRESSPAPPSVSNIIAVLSEWSVGPGAGGEGRLGSQEV